jgi:death on curing protein
MPSASYAGEYLHQNLYDMSAAYFFHIVQNHPFIDGNKRTGVVAAIVFLSLNGIEIQVDENALEKLVLSVAEGKKTKSKIARFLENNSSFMV